MINDEGLKSPFFIDKKMIKKQVIIDLINEHFAGTDKFVVDVKVLTGNKIEVYVDAPQHIVIADCVALSRYIEGSLDREKEDFELQVSSPGATQPFKVVEQYKKYANTQVEVVTKEGTKHKGLLLSANDAEFELEETRRQKKTLGKGNETVIEKITFNYNQIKETANQTLEGLDYDFKVFDNPAELRDFIFEKNNC